MKQAIILIVACILFTINSAAQHYPWQPKQKRRMCAATIVGISGLSVGVMGTLGGLVMQLDAGSRSESSGLPYQVREEQYDRDSRRARAVTYTGLGFAIAGAVSMVCGIITDRHHNHSRFTVISPKINETGIAYNF